MSLSSPSQPTPAGGADPGAAAESRTQGVVRRPGLDVIRGLAVALVLLRHSFAPTFPNAGITGVVLFFALSGYLITGVLSSEMKRRGRVSFRRFYRNRLIRLYPALLALLAIFVAVELSTDLLDDRAKVWRSFWGAVTYTTDIWTDGLSAAVSHLWTLAIEEQFYLLWPVVLVFALRRRRVGTTLLVGTVVVLVACWSVIRANSSQVQVVYVYPTSWAVIMLIGAAGHLYRDRLRRVLSGRVGQATALVAVATVIALTFLPESKNRPWLYLVVGPVIGVCAVLMILQAERWSTLPAVLAPLRVLGLVSYAAYLWNFPIVRWLTAANDGVLDWPQRWATIPLTVLAATLSWWLVEKPFVRYRQRLDTRDGPGPRAATVQR